MCQNVFINRMVPILPPLKKFLSLYRDENKLHSLAPPNWRARFERISKAAGYRDEKDEASGLECATHSYGTYQLVVVKHEHQVVEEMGNSSEMIIKHCRRVVASSTAEAYWSDAKRRPQR